MPFYQLDELEKKNSPVNSKIECGNGELGQDYHLRPEAREIEKLYPGKKG